MTTGAKTTGRGGMETDCDCIRAGKPALFALLGALAMVACAGEPSAQSAAAGSAASGAADDAAGITTASGSTFRVRLDSESSDPTEFRLVEDDDGIRVQTGPAGIAYREDDSIRSGTLQVQGTFRQFGAPVGYREAYGIFVGGLDLAGPDLEYTYLLVRPTGDYMVKRRIGAITETLVDWTPHPSVHSVQQEGDEPVNVLAIDVFEGETHFVVNGDVVHQESASRVRPYGIAGIRVNHRLDVRVDDWVVRSSSTESQ